MNSISATDVLEEEDGDEILLAVGGQLLAFGTAQVDRAAGGDCLAEIPPIAIAAPGGEMDFGAQVVIGDVDANDEVDILLTAPSTQRAYLMVGAQADLQVVTIEGTDATGTFGEAVALIDLDGDERDEVIIGDPGADPEGVADAGVVHIYRYEEDRTLDVTRTLFDSTPVAGQRFGRSLSLAEFVSTPQDTDVLVVGAKGEVFVYFRSLVSGRDPRH